MGASLGSTAGLAASLVLGLGLLCPTPAAADDARQLLRIDHYVRVKSTAPAIAGQDAQLYVREVVEAGTALRAPPGAKPVVLFIHGAGTPAEVAFDVPVEGYSWMAHLAREGFDVFAMDVTGYGRSTRPAPMNDPCNLSAAAQTQFIPGLIPQACPPSHPRPISTMSSDWDDIGAVVDHLRRLRGVDQVSLVAWSQGAPRSLGYAARNPEKVARAVVLAPAYTRAGPDGAPAEPAASSGPLTSQSRREFDAGWDRQLGCPGQYDPAVREAVWSEMLASDPVGATWGPGVRRAPQVPTWGFNRAVVSRMRTPVLMVAAPHDRQVLPERVRELYADLGSPQKVIVDLACTSHNAMWETNRGLLFEASADWLREGRVRGQTEGELKLGY